MTRKYLERRNNQIMVLVDRRKMAPKDIAASTGIPYDNVRKIISLFRKRHNNSQKFTSHIPR